MTEHFSTSSFHVFPDNLNYGNTLFGGKLLAEIDCEASKVAKSVIYGTAADNAVTARFEGVDFIAPARQGNLVIMEADLVKLGTTSMTIKVDCYIKIGSNKERWILICSAITIFVALKNGKKFPHGKTMEQN